MLSCLGHLICGDCTGTVDDVARDNERVEKAKKDIPYASQSRLLEVCSIDSV